MQCARQDYLCRQYFNYLMPWMCKITHTHFFCPLKKDWCFDVNTRGVCVSRSRNSPHVFTKVWRACKLGAIVTPLAAPTEAPSDVGTRLTGLFLPDTSGIFSPGLLPTFEQEVCSEQHADWNVFFCRRTLKNVNSVFQAIQSLAQTWCPPPFYFFPWINLCTEIFRISGYECKKKKNRI